MSCPGAPKTTTPLATYVPVGLGLAAMLLSPTADVHAQDETISAGGGDAAPRASQEAPPVSGQDDTKPWADEAELSFVSTGGNTDVQTLSAKNTFKYRFNKRLGTIWKVSALNGKTDGVRTAERYWTDLRLEYSFSARAYSYVRAGWLKDEFAGLDRRVDGGLGAGYKFLTGPTSLLNGELGLTVADENYTDDTQRSFTEGRAFVEYVYKFTKRNRFTQSVEYLYDFDDTKNYRANSETALIAALNSNLSLKVSYVVNYDNAPTPDTLDTTDTALSVAVVVNY